VNGLASVVAPLRAVPRLGTLTLLLLITYGYFVGPAGWNQNSRLALTRALVEERSTIIDAYHVTTGDKSHRDGHFYSDKAPGLSIVATIPYAGFYLLRRLTGRELPGVEVVPLDPIDRAAARTPEPDQLGAGDRLVYNHAHRIALYVCRLFSSSLLSLLGLAAFFLLVQRQLQDARRAVLVTLTFGLATPAFAYGTAFYAHQPCAALLLIAFAVVVLLPAGFRPRGRDRLAPLLVGASLGLAVMCEYPAAVPAALITAWASWRRGGKFGAWIAAGGMPFALALAAYHQAAFGHPLSTGYDHVYLERFAEGMAINYGIGAPDPSVLLQLLFGSYRGLFYISPILLLAAWGLFLHAAARGARVRSFSPLAPGDLLLVLLLVAYYLLLNSGYYMWDGGASLGPRHAIPMLGFLALGLAPALLAVPRAYLLLAILSMLWMLAATAVGPEAPQHGDPIWGHALPQLFADSGGGATNVGRLLGLPSVLGLLPLLGMWAWLWPLRRGETTP
jgi:hypothetical protein